MGVCLMCPLNLPVKFCSPRDALVHLLSGWALQQAFVTCPDITDGSSHAGRHGFICPMSSLLMAPSCLLIPAGAQGV